MAKNTNLRMDILEERQQQLETTIVSLDEKIGMLQQMNNLLQQNMDSLNTMLKLSLKQSDALVSKLENVKVQDRAQDRANAQVKHADVQEENDVDVHEEDTSKPVVRSMTANNSTEVKGFNVRKNRLGAI